MRRTCTGHNRTRSMELPPTSKPLEAMSERAHCQRGSYVMTLTRTHTDSVVTRLARLEATEIIAESDVEFNPSFRFERLLASFMIRFSLANMAFRSWLRAESTWQSPCSRVSAMVVPLPEHGSSPSFGAPSRVRCEISVRTRYDRENIGRAALSRCDPRSK